MTDQQFNELVMALSALVRCCANKTGQSYKIRALLYSLWNGKPTSLLEFVSIDQQLKLWLLMVIAGFGQPDFFYDQIKEAFVAQGLFDWFIEEGDAK